MSTEKPKKVLIANRGAIASRILRTAKKMGWETVTVHSVADAETPAARDADFAVNIGGPEPSSSYLDSAKILHAARATGADIVHPGYGFLSENADFCEACEAEGFAFAGPTPQQMRDFGLKNTAREVARKCGVPLLPGTDLLETADEACASAAAIGFPVMLKSTAGGGGIGMRVCRNEPELRNAYESVRRLGETNFRHGGVFLEKFVERARHIEVQIFGDGRGNVLALGERDCSTQRRNQKVIEECPAPNLDSSVRSALHGSAVLLGKAVSYRSAGTVEFLYDEPEKKFYFLEVNTRLQVEHGVTEEVFGVDLVEWMLRLAAGEMGFFDAFSAAPTQPTGTAIQARIYAEIPAKNFQPSTGTITSLKFPTSSRVETWVETGTEVTGCYDPMLAKIISAAPSREEARQKLRAALETMELHGIETNQAYLQSVLASPEFSRGNVTTSFLSLFAFSPLAAEVLEGGIETLVVDCPGRTGYWDVGVPPSGAFDDRSFRLANEILQNAAALPGLEMTLRGPSLKFYSPARCCLAGAEMNATLDGKKIALFSPFRIEAGQTLKIGEAKGPGMRGYLAFEGGLDVPEYLGSKTTFRLGGFGGHGGRALRPGDFLRFFHGKEPETKITTPCFSENYTWSKNWVLGVAYGPHGAPDFFTDRDIEMFFSTEWEVHYNSARTGVRLIGPKPEWARPDGGEAGLHPSNIHDNAYQVGAVDFTGDMPIILGPDGPSLGGFVCPATVLQREFWKVGQLRPGDKVRFCATASDSQNTPPSFLSKIEPAILSRNTTQHPAPAAVYRRQGDSGILVEYGDMVLDLPLRFRVQALYELLREQAIPGILEMTPGIRSLQVRYDRSKISEKQVLSILENSESEIPPVEKMVVPNRIIHLPLSWDDASTRLAIEKYMQSVRPDAPWCPSNIEFIRRINGLSDIGEVQQIVFSANYLVMGLGDVYLGAPVATPLDPRHRLVTTKYNPARTWTPENAVGIGGAYLCIYGMEGPGGYQFVGRTVPVWNRYKKTRSFTEGRPWLLRFFDQIRFYPVSHEELLVLRRDILTGKFNPRVEESEFRLQGYTEFLQREKNSIDAFQHTQRKAFAEERERWKQAGQPAESAFSEKDLPPLTDSLPPGCFAAESPAAGSLWKLLVTVGQRVSEGEPVAILESMKMEIPCLAPSTGTVHSLPVQEGKPILPGQKIAVFSEP